MAHKVSTFSCFLFDPQLLAAIPWVQPLPVQSEVIPHALDGKNLAIRSRTGSGKTGAYLLPTIHSLLCKRRSKALILTPTQELCSQIYRVTKELTKNMCDINVQMVAASSMDLKSVSIYRTPPNILVTTVGCLSALAKRKEAEFDVLVVDEADLCAALNPLKDLSKMMFPSKVQVMLVSATLDNRSIDRIRQRIDRTLCFVHVSQKECLPSNLCQFWIDCTTSSTSGANDEEKFLILVSLIKLNLIFPGPVLIFTSSNNRAYRIRIILEQFGVAACSLNSELPQASKQHILDSFQQGIHDILVTTDSADVSPRGIDFRPIQFVVNFDLPDDPNVYIHRVGRAARLDAEGVAISLVGPSDMEGLARLTSALGDRALSAYPFPQAQVEGFRYRVREATRAANKMAVRRARVSEIRQEMLNSDKLKAYFFQNERDYELLCQHGKALGNPKIIRRFKNTPKYILTAAGQMTGSGQDTAASRKRRRPWKKQAKD